MDNKKDKMDNKKEREIIENARLKEERIKEEERQRNEKIRIFIENQKYKQSTSNSRRCYWDW